MLDIVDPHPKRLVTDKEAAENPRRIAEVHRVFRPEVPVHQIAGAVMQRPVKLVEIDLIQQMAMLRALRDALQHAPRRHHHFQQGREGGDALEYEIQVIGDVANAKAEVAFLGAVQGEFVDAVTQPVIVGLPVLPGDKAVEGLFDHGQPARIAGQAVQTHQAEGRFAVVIDDAERGLDVECRVIQHMHEFPGGRVLHMADTERQFFQQREVLFAGKQLAVFDQRQQAHGIAAQLDFIAHVQQERRPFTAGQGHALDQLRAQIVEPPFDGLRQARFAGNFPGFEHGVQGAGMAQGVIGVDRAVETRMPAIVEPAVVPDLGGQKVAAPFDHAVHRVGVTVEHPPTGIVTGGVECQGWRAEVAEQAFGGQQVHRRVVAEVRHQPGEAAAGIESEVLFVELRVAHLAAAVEHGVAVEFAFEKGPVEVCVQGQAVAEVIAFERLQAGLQHLPGQRLGLRHPVRPQPAYLHVAPGRTTLAGGAEFLPERLQIRPADMHYRSAAAAVTE